MSAEHELTEARVALTEACKLLELARCPDVNCDNKGTVCIGVHEHGSGELEMDLHQCQWCDERKQLIEEHG